MIEVFLGGIPLEFQIDAGEIFLPYYGMCVFFVCFYNILKIQIFILSFVSSLMSSIFIGYFWALL